MLPQKDTLHLEIIDQLIREKGGGLDAIASVMKFLHSNREQYYWVGIYQLVGNMLELGPYAGPATDHTKIPVGRGVCGTAVQENANQVVDDVRERANYLACNLETRSEIVVLIRDPQTQAILGQIDVDGTRVGQFRDEEAFLVEVANRLAPHLIAINYLKLKG